MKNLFNKITKNIFLPLAVAGGIYSAGFSQTTTDSLIKYNLENKKVYEDFVKFIKENGEKRDKEISYLKIIEKSKIFSVSLDSDENPKLIELGYFKVGYGKKFRDNFPWGMERNDMCGDSHLKKSYEEVRTDDEIEMIKDLSPDKQFSLAKEYTETLKEIMRDAGVSGY